MRNGEERVQRQCDAARPDRAPERHGIIDRIVQQECDALLLAQAERAQSVGKANAARLQLAVREGAIGIDEGDLAGAAERDVRVDEIGYGVIGTACCEILDGRSPLYR